MLGAVFCTHHIVWDGFKLHDDFGTPRRHSLSGSEIERHAGPAPVVHVRANRDKGLGGGLLTDLVGITGNHFALNGPRLILGADDILGQRLNGNRPQGPQDFELLGSKRVGFQRSRRFHGDQTRQLEQMVLHHVAQCAGLFVIGGALSGPQRFRHRDLHVIDSISVPKWLKKIIGEAQNQQILNALLAEIVIDSEDCILGEDLAHLVVDRTGRLQVGSDGFLKHDSGIWSIELMPGERFADGAIERRGQGQIEKPDLFRIIVQRFTQNFPAWTFARGINRHVGEMLGELRPFLGALALARMNVLDGHFAKHVLGQIVSGRSHDARRIRKLPVAPTMEERRHQFSQRQVTGGPKDHDVEGFNGDQFSHSISPRRGEEALEEETGNACTGPMVLARFGLGSAQVISACVFQCQLLVAASASPRPTGPSA